MIRRGSTINKLRDKFSKSRKNSIQRDLFHEDKSGVVNVRVAVCVIAKWEEQYLPEWVEHYKSIGFDNVLFYDNNEPDDNGQYVVLKPYIDSGFVIYHDWKGESDTKTQKVVYKNCMNQYKMKYDWIAFFDADEFLELVNHETIKEFIESNEKFKDFETIMFNWIDVGDNDMVYNNNKPLKQRFNGAKELKRKTIKSLVRTLDVCDKRTKTVHSPFWTKEGICNSDGNAVGDRERSTMIPNTSFNDCFIKHYKCKTLEEHLRKIRRGDCNPRGYKHFLNELPLIEKIGFHLKQFFEINEVTVEKLNLIKKIYPQFIETEYYKKILEKTREICSGCSACENVCPTKAIELKEDSLTGFKLIEIDIEKCINCGRCTKVCPHKTIKLHDLSTQKKYAFKSLDEDILKKSSSGGAFTHITKPLLEQGWKVIGVKWNKEWHAEYAIADTVEEWEKFRKSKYMQADMGDLFPRIREMLDNGEKIVFSGVPCHVSGLLNYLGKEYDNLLTIDLLCGALHSPKIWDKWYEYEGLDKSTFTNIDMRYKCNNSTEKYTIHIEKSNGQVHDIMTATTPIWSLTYCGRKMAMNVCHNCRYRDLNRVSDITISDMHNVKYIAPEFLDNKNNNVSSILCNTVKGQEIINELTANSVYIKEIEGVVKMPKNFKKRNLKREFERISDNGIEYLKSTEKVPYDIAICGGTFNANFGATLTYYALYRYLEMIGKRVVILPPLDKKYNGGMLEGNVFDKYCNIAPNFFKTKPTRFNEVSNTFILGSDQMWNPKCGLYTKLGLKSFLNYINNNKTKIAYSVSTGGKIFPGTINDDNKYDEIKRLLSKFEAISCREQDGCELLKKHCGIVSEHTVDPVFLLPKEEYEKIIEESKIDIPRGEYGCFYALLPNERELNFFHELSKKNGVEEIIIGCGQPNNYKKYSSKFPNEKFVNPINAQDWLKYIKNAKYVVTTSFHCVCFCIMFNIPFICLRDIKNIRINWILGSTNLRGNYLKELDINKAIEIINKPINHLHYLNSFMDYSKNWLNKKISHEK